MRLTTALSGSLLALTLALTGCGGDDSDDGSATDNNTSENDSGEASDSGDEPEDDGPDQVDVCGLITVADLEAAFGSPFDEGEFTHQEQTGGDQCVWSNKDAPPVKVFSITVLREGHLSENFEAAGVTVKGLFEDTKELFPESEEVDLGDDAYLSGTELAVLDGDTSYSFSTTTGTSAEAINGMKSLAEKVVG